MKKLATAVLLTVIGLAMTTTTVAAQFVYVGGGPSFPMSDYGDYANTGFQLVGGVGVPIGDAGLNVLGEFSYGQNNHTDASGGGKTTPITVMGGVEYDFGGEDASINPYVFGQAGILWHRFVPDTGDSESDSAFGYGGGAGVGFPLGGVNGWVEGRITNASIKDDVSNESFNTMFAAIVAGISINFGG